MVTTSAVTDHLEKRRIPFELIHHSQTYTSIDEARELGIAADEVVKTLALKTRGGDVVAVIPASSRLDMHLVGEALGDKHARLATEEELEADFPEFELGALPPLGSLLRVRILVDADVMRHETVVFASGKQTESVRLRNRGPLPGRGHRTGSALDAPGGRGQMIVVIKTEVGRSANVGQATARIDGVTEAAVVTVPCG